MKKLTATATRWFGHLARVALWLIVIAGCLVIAGSYGLEDGWPRVSRWLHTIGVTVLASGVFSATVKSYRLAGVFKEELGAALRAELPSLLQRSGTIEEWRQVCSTVMQESVPPDMAAAAADHLRAWFVQPQTVGSYAESLHLTYVLDWDPDDDTFYVVTESSSMTIRTINAERVVPFRFEWTEMDHEGQRFRGERVSVNGAELEGTQEVLPNGNRRCVYDEPLAGRTAYRVDRKSTRRSSLLVEPSLTVIQTRWARDARISVTKPIDMQLTVEPVGFGAPIQLSEEQGRVLTFEIPLLAPEQGFRIELRRISKTTMPPPPAEAGPGA